MVAPRATKPQVTKYRRSLTRHGFALALLYLPSLPALAQPAPAARQPNVVIILADDLGYGC